jgi:hypothetical protein
MGFSKYAKATFTNPVITQAGWDDVRSKAFAPAPTFEVRRASQIVLQQYDPAQYLLSHCTIIASVDTEKPGMPTGSQMFDGLQINRQFPDFYVTAGTAKYVNNNQDCWERKLLLASFRTFIGGENYVEHVQIPELSKGKIIDAAARDIGESVYVDILIATDRKHKDLIAAITDGRLSTLSMGCHVSFTICTKCGNVAEDETQLCRHIKYEKGHWFLDAKGQRRKIAELCGHITKEPGSVKFIEGSWVAHPAFSGAVLRSILDPKTAELAEAARQKIQVAYMRPTEVFDPNMMQKAARLAPIGVGAVAKPADYLSYLYDGPSIGTLHAPPAFSGTAKAAETHKARLEEISGMPRRRNNRLNSAQQDFPGQSEMGDSSPSTPDTEESTRPFKQVINDLYHSLVDEVTNKVKKDISDSNKGEESTLDENRSNESLIRSALRYAKWRERSKMVLANVKDPSKARNVLAGLILHDMGGWEAVGKANRFSGREILVMDRLIERTEKKSSMAGDARIYRTVIALGGTASYPDVDSYLTACREVLGRTLTNSEMVQLVTKGKLFSLGLR